MVKSSFWQKQPFDSVVRLHFGRPCWMQRGSGRVCLGSWIFPTVSGGLLPGYYTLRWGWSPSAPNKGNVDGTVGIFGKCRVRVGYGPAPGPTKKRPCATLSRSVGRGTNTAASYRNSIRALETGDRTRSPYLLP